MPSPSTKHTFYTVFSNSPFAEDYLPNLSAEAGKISDHLNGLAFSDIIYYMKDELFTADRLLETFMRYGDKFTIFYFSGHAKGGSLKLSDNFMANTTKMAALINNLRNLKLAFFNACETFDLAREIIKKRLASKKPQRIELIACGREVNTYAAEQFGMMFIIDAGRDGTIYTAYTHARDYVVFANDNVVFREFTTLAEVEAAKGDFDFAYIDVDPEKFMGTTSATPAIAAAAPQPQPVGAASGTPAAPASAVAASLPPSVMPVSSEDAPAAGPIPGATAAPVPESPENKPPPSMLKTDKKTDDILAANYLSESIQLMLSSKNLKPEQSALLNDAVDKVKAVADGSAVTAKIKEVWEQAARLLPGVNGDNDFRALAKVSKDSYNGALDQFYGRMEHLPVVDTIKARLEPVDTARVDTKEPVLEASANQEKQESMEQVQEKTTDRPKDKQPDQPKEAKAENREKKSTAKAPAH